MRKLVYAAIFIALYVVLDSFSIQILPSLRITISMLAVAMAGSILGWQYGGLVGFASDLLMFFLKNNAFGPYMPQLTLSAILVGVIFGLVVHNITPPIKPCIFLHLKFRIMHRCRTCLTPVKLRPSALPNAKFLRNNYARSNRRSNTMEIPGLARNDILIRVIVAQVLVTLFINLLWNTWTLSLYYSAGFRYFFVIRFWAEIAAMVVLVVLEYLTLIAMRRIFYEKI